MIRMLARLLDWLTEGKRIWKSIVILSLISLLFSLIIFPSLNIGTLLDSLFSYSPETAYKIIREYTPQGRSIYTLSALTLDMIFPIIYSLLLGVILTGLWQKLGLNQEKWDSFRFVPFLVGVMDFGENISISILLWQYPQKLERVAQLASLLTSLKWILLGLTVVSILILSVIVGVRYIINKKNTENT